MDTPSKRVWQHLTGDTDVDFEVIHMGAPKCPPPYGIVFQSGGDLEVAQISIQCYGKTPESATDAANKVRKAMKYAQIGNAVPSLLSWAETYMVPTDLDVRAGVELRYNLPVYQER